MPVIEPPPPALPKPNSVSTVRRMRRVLASTLELPDPLARGLERFAELTRRFMLWEAASWIVAALLLAFTFIAVLDRCTLMEDSTRRVLALAGYCTALTLAITLLHRALRPRQATEVALALEAQAPKESVQERISTTVELASRPDAEAGLSSAMVERVADEAAECIQLLNIDALPDRRKLQRALRCAGVLLGLVVFLCIPSRLRMRSAYCRAFFPWANLQRPGDTNIEVLTGSTRVVDGEAVEIQVHTSGEPVSDAYLETRPAGGHWQELRMEGDASAGHFTLTLGPVHEKMEYRVRAGDGRSAAYDIDVLPRPEISGLKISVTYPEYTHLPAQTFERLNGDISALKGSHVELNVSANTKLDAALLEFPDDRRVSMAVANASASTAFDIALDTTYRVRLRSTDGVGNPDAPLFSIHALPDMPPQVTVIKPQSDESVDANSVLALEARGEDDFGIQSMQIVAQAEEQHEPIVIPLEKPGDGGKVWMISQPWDLAGLALNGTQTITYRVEAIDTNGSIGKSDERRLRLSGGAKQQLNELLASLDETQRRLTSAREQLARAQHDVNDMRLVFRADDTDFQAADRLLLSETLNRIAREARSAAGAIDRGLPSSEAGPLQTLLQALSGSLTRFADTELRPLHRAALRAKSTEAEAIRTGLDTIAEILPESEKELLEIHEAFTAAHRYAAATQLETRATDIHETQSRILPILIGAAAWTPKGTAFPGLLTEYYRGSALQTLLRRTIEPCVVIDDKKLNLNAADGVSIRWSGQVLAPRAGRYTFGAAEEGVRVHVDGKLVLDQWAAQIADDSDKSFVAVGEWTPAPAQGQSFKDGFRYAAAGTGARTATWSFTRLVPGRYRISTTWTPNPNRASDAPYTIFDGNTALTTVHVNQQAVPADFTDQNIPWKDLGAPARISGSTLMVRLTDQANQYVIADAVRIERVESTAVARADAAVELTEGWHDFAVELHRCEGKPEIHLLSAGPGLPKAPLPPERLRNIATAATVPLDARVRADMGKSASAAAVKHALVRLQNMIELARTLPPELSRIAAFPPKADEQGQKEGTDWTALIGTQTLGLEAAKAATPDLAMPLLTWGDQCANWVNNYKAVRERYRQAMLQFSTKLAPNAYSIASEFRTLQREAAAAQKAYTELLNASHQPADAKREMAMAKADSTVRALADDLRTQATEIAAELKDAASDVRKPIDERRALQALEARAETLARGSAADLDRRLKDARTPEELAKTEQNRPNLATDTENMQREAGELAALTEREERAVRLRDELKRETDALTAARDALTKAPSGETAAQQQRSAAELKHESSELQNAAVAATNMINPQFVGQAAQIAQNPVLAQAEDLLQKRANETFSGEKLDPQRDAAEQKARPDTATELDKQAKAARDTTAAVNKELGALAQAWNGDATTPLAQAANEVQEAAKSLTQIPADQPVQGNNANLNNAADHAENAREKAEHTADRLALDAEALRNPGATPDQRAQADDFDRLAAAIRHEASEKVDPAASMLDAARNDPGQQTRLPKVLPEQAKSAEDELRKLSQIAAEIGSSDPNARKQGHEKLDKELHADGLAESVDQALKSANALDQMAGQLESSGEKKADPNAPANPAPPNGQAGEKNAAAQNKPEDLDAQRQALAKAMSLDPKAADAAEQQALAQRIAELAHDLHNEAEHDRQVAESLERAGGLEERAREKLKKEGAALAQDMQQAGNAAAQLAKTSPPMSGPLHEAQKALEQTGQALGATAKQAGSEPLEKLAAEVDKAGQSLEKPVADLANALGQPDDANTKQAQQIGAEARDDAGHAADLAEELRRAGRAEELARDSDRADTGTRAQLEKEVRDALAALEKKGGINADDAAALQRALADTPSSGSEKNGAPEKTPQSGTPQNGAAAQPNGTPQNGAAQPSLDAASKQARSNAEKMEQMAARMEKFAGSMQAGAPDKSMDNAAADASASPMADAMRALSQAEAAQETGDASKANSLKQQAAELLDQAAEAARGQVTGMQTAGTPEAQSLAMKQSGKPNGKNQSQGKGDPGKQANNSSKQKGDGGKSQSSSSGSSSGQKSAQTQENTTTARTSALVPPPDGLPIDAATWNRLPDDLRRDLLNAAGSRFPAEYEMSIRRYFKNVAAIQQDHPRQERP